MQYVDTEIFNGFAEDERKYSFLFDGIDTSKIENMEMNCLLSGREYEGDILAKVLRDCKIYVADDTTDSCRVLSAMASGCLVLMPVRRVFDEMGYRDNVHYSLYKSGQDLREQIDFFLNDRVKRVCTARTGQYFTTSNYTKKIMEREKCA